MYMTVGGTSMSCLWLFEIQSVLSKIKTPGSNSLAVV